MAWRIKVLKSRGGGGGDADKYIYVPYMYQWRRKVPKSGGWGHTDT